jgi:uncharacterized protein (TIGR00645 family)
MKRSRLGRRMEAGLFASRWLLAPFYVGLAFALASLLVVFAISLGEDLFNLTETPLAKLPEAGILMSLSMIDLSLTGNLVIIVILSGYENFVARIDTAQVEDRPTWMGKVDFSNLKIKLIASIVAISAIALLRSYLEIDDHGLDQAKLLWQVVILLTFVVSGAVLALMDFIVSRTERR